MVLDASGLALTSSLAVIAVAGAAAAVLARRLNQPTLVAFILAGILLGPVFGLVSIGPALEALGEFGIALLLFLVGLDLSLPEARAVGPPALAAGAGQLAVSAVGGFALARLLGFDVGTALFLAVALAFSSTVLVVKILADLDELATTHGRLAVGVLLVQDVVIVLLLTLIPVLGEGRDLAPGALAVESALAAGRTFALVAAALLGARFLLPRVLRFAAGHAGLVLLLGLAWLFLFIGASVRLGVSLEVGAFAAGLSLAPTPFAGDLRRGVNPILDLFIALFFVSLGVGVELAQALALLPAALAFSAFVIVTKTVVLTGLLSWMGYSRRSSFRTGVTVGQVSEFSFVLAAIAVSQDLLAPDVRAFVVLVGMLTMGASALLIWRSDALHDALAGAPLFRRVPDGSRDVATVAEAPHDHALVLGWDRHGAAAARALRERGERVVVLAARRDVLEALPEGVQGLYGDPQDTRALDAAGVRDARVVVANLPEPGLVRSLLGHVAGDPPVVARAETSATARLLADEGAAAVIRPPAVIADAMLSALDGEARRDG